MEEETDEILSGVESTDGSFSSTTRVNTPKLNGTGLTPVKIGEGGVTETVDTKKEEWYSYDGTTNKWANAVTKNTLGEITGYFVWIPRYAYKITYTNENNKAAGGTIDVVLLQGTTNKDANGKDVTSADYVDEKGNIGPYIVHPAFTDESKTGYQNGGWDSEISGFWVAKFEAGYDGTAGDKTSATDSNVNLKVIEAYNGRSLTNVTSNYYGTRAIGDKIKYPVFKANRPSISYIGISDAYELCLDIKNGTSVYGLRNIDSHMIKNSEWGAVVYLTHSKYGRNGQEVTINNVTANGTSMICAATGYGASNVNANADASRNLETLLTEGQTGSWTTEQGQNASSTGNIYGIYDLNGGEWEWTAGYIGTTGNHEKYGGNLKEESSKYKTKYEGTSWSELINYSTSPNQIRLGEAIWEISNAGSGTSSWNGEYSTFLSENYPFLVRGGEWDQNSYAGIFSFSTDGGYGNFRIGFRPVLIAE